MPIPNKKECFYILEMIKSGLINFTYTHPWAEKIIGEVDVAPWWVCDLASKSYQGDLEKALREYIYSGSIEPVPPNIERFHLACLWLRYERREHSWATFLLTAGMHLDGANGGWNCETPFHYLNMHAAAYFSVDSELETKKRYLADQDLLPWIELAKHKFEPFLKLRRTNKPA